MAASIGNGYFVSSGYFSRMEQNQPQKGSPASTDSTIFSAEDLGPGQYDKTIRNARTALFVLAGIQGVMSLILFAGNGSADARLVNMIIGLAVAGIFLGLGFYSRKKPFTAIVSGLIVYSSLILLDAAFDPSSLLNGIVLKVVVIIYFLQALRDARDAQQALKH